MVVLTSVAPRSWAGEAIGLFAGLSPPGTVSTAAVGDSDYLRMAVIAAMMFSPFSVEQPTILRVNAIAEEAEIIGPRIQIKVVADSTVMSEKKTKPPRKPAAKKAPSKLRKRPYEQVHHKDHNSGRRSLHYSRY